MFKKILIANRGEIAVRVMRTCQEMGIETVAVYSQADETAAHVMEADQALFIGEAEPAKSYLNQERLLEAATQSGAQAIHPGYGFLAENADFAARCEESGLTFIGPPARVIQALGNKTVARQIMQEAGVPVIPGMMEAFTHPDPLKREAEALGYPVILKAAAGGGGKGMRIVQSPREMEAAVDSAMSEAQNAFSDGRLYVEKHLKSPRHIEFQILCDAHGNALHLFERECSIQRRHQKIIEETPSPALTPVLREVMGEAAVAAAKASGYVNAGTVEFLLDAEGQFYFLEVNTRLQVEHPVTEMTTGLDLVRHQIDIAAGNPLELRQEAIPRTGHAIECRIYAEDPEADFFPCSGPVLLHHPPSGPGIRNDCGIWEGAEVPMEYDPIVSKLIAAGPSREAARQRLIRALESYVILGVTTTIPFLIDILKSGPFKAGDTPTDFIDQHFQGWKPRAADMDLAMIAYAAHDMTRPVAPPSGAKEQGAPTPWDTLKGWRL